MALGSARIGSEGGGETPWLVAGFCEAQRAREIEAFFAPRVDALEGGPRNLAASIERVRLCAALVDAQAGSSRAFFSDGATGPDGGR